MYDAVLVHREDAFGTIYNVEGISKREEFSKTSYHAYESRLTAEDMMYNNHEKLLREGWLPENRTLLFSSHSSFNNRELLSTALVLNRALTTEQLKVQITRHLLVRAGAAAVAGLGPHALIAVGAVGVLGTTGVVYSGLSGTYDSPPYMGETVPRAMLGNRYGDVWGIAAHREINELLAGAGGTSLLTDAERLAALNGGFSILPEALPQVGGTSLHNDLLIIKLGARAY